MALIYLASILLSPAFVQGRTEVERLAITPGNHSQFSVYANALGRAHYNAWTCNYRSEPGYKCISCSEALHCYPANFALLVQCAGLFPHCRNGYCSRFKTEGCNEEYMIAEGTHGPLRVTTVANDKFTTLADEHPPSETSAQVPDESTSMDPITGMIDSNTVDENVTSTTVETELKPHTDKDPRRF